MLSKDAQLNWCCVCILNICWCCCADFAATIASAAVYAVFDALRCPAPLFSTPHSRWSGRCCRCTKSAVDCSQFARMCVRNQASGWRNFARLAGQACAEHAHACLARRMSAGTAQQLYLSSDCKKQIFFQFFIPLPSGEEHLAACPTAFLIPLSPSIARALAQ